MSGLYRSSTQSLADPEGFWLETAEAIDWIQPPRAALDRSDAPFYRWFPMAN